MPQMQLETVLTHYFITRFALPMLVIFGVAMLSFMLVKLWGGAR
jgi:hypothetical protein